MNLRLICSLCAIVMATGVAAAEFPALFRVTGVAADDVLNVRSEPNARAGIVFELPPDRDDLEVLWMSDDGKWARVGLGEVSGWVSARFIEAQDPSDPRSLPVPMRCVGVEPFWGLHIPTTDFAEYEMLPEPERAFEIVHQGAADGRGPSELSAWLEGEDSQGALLVERAACSDGMSDRDYALRARFVLRTTQQTVFHVGCCYISGH